MKTVILAGGRGTRMAPETEIIPKPMVTIGGIPIIQHIMNYYMSFGFYEFVILGGYKIEIITKYFTEHPEGDWMVTVVDTGEDTPTGERLAQVEYLLREPFFLTYGDGLSNIPINKVYEQLSEVAIISAVHPPGRFGTLSIGGFSDDSNIVTSFNEKQRLTSEWVNGGFMAMTPTIFNYIEKGEMLEFQVFPRLVDEGKLQAYRHEGWWQPMDTPRDREILEKLYHSRRCPWRK